MSTLLQVDTIRRWIKPFAFLVLLISLLCVFYLTFFSSQFRLSSCPSCVVSEVNFSASLTNISHIFFGIDSSIDRWNKNRGYVELWWRPGKTRGYVWLDRNPLGTADVWPATVPPYRVSRKMSKPLGREAAVREARSVAETYKAVKALGSAAEDEVRWLVIGYDDTVFFTENLVTVLGKYDHREMYYVGGVSESVEQDLFHSYGMAFGGAGVAVSWPAASEISRILDGCLVRYASLYGGDERIHACMEELGVPLTREPGFHEVDIHGNPFGLLAAHPVAPLVTLHQLDVVRPMFPGIKTQMEAAKKLIRVTEVDPSRVLQQSICYIPDRNWSISVSWGYSVQVYPWVLSPIELVTPFQTFQTWRSFQTGPFTVKTRPLSTDACKKPLIFFLDDFEIIADGSRTKYKKQMEEKACEESLFMATSKLDSVSVVAPKMDPNEWKKAPRRHCCEAQVGKTLEVRIRKCRQGETCSPP